MLSNDIANLNFYDINILNQNWKKGESFSYKDSCRPYHGICFIAYGKIKYESENGTITAEPGDIVILNKCSRYRASFTSDATQDILINFQCDTQDIFMPAKENAIIFKSRFDMQKIFFDILNHQSAAEKCMIKSAFYKILHELSVPKTSNEIYNKIKHAIDNNIENNLNESDLAKECSISISTLQRTFKKISGITVSAYKTELKIAKAKDLLISENKTIEEIAEQLGFCDSSYFGKCFKKSEGISPKEYLKQHYTM